MLSESDELSEPDLDALSESELDWLSFSELLLPELELWLSDF